MSAILKFYLQKRKQLRFYEINYLNYHTQKKRPNFACDKYIFPKTRENKNKQWTRSTPVKSSQRFIPPLVNGIFLKTDQNWTFGLESNDFQPV